MILGSFEGVTRYPKTYRAVNLYVDEDANLSQLAIGGHNLRGVRLKGGEQLSVATSCGADLRRSRVAARTFRVMVPPEKAVATGSLYVTVSA
jgi:hypothetical protein